MSSKFAGSKRSVAAKSRVKHDTATKRGRKKHIMFDLANGADWKDVEPFQVPNTYVSTIYKKVCETMNAQGMRNYAIVLVHKKDPLPLRFYLGQDEQDYCVDPNFFRIWVIPERVLNDEMRADWSLFFQPSEIPRCGTLEYNISPWLFQPGMQRALRQVRAQFPQMDKCGRFLVDKKDGQDWSVLDDFLSKRWVGAIASWTHNRWDPPVRIAGEFNRVVTCSHKYVSTHPQGRIRLLFQQSMLVPDSAQVAQGFEVGDALVGPDDSESEDAPDIVVSSKLKNFFRGHKRWIVEGSRRNIDEFIFTHMRQPDHGVFRMVNSGYAMYLVPKMPPSFRF